MTKKQKQRMCQVVSKNKNCYDQIITCQLGHHLFFNAVYECFTFTSYLLLQLMCADFRGNFKDQMSVVY